MAACRTIRVIGEETFELAIFEGMTGDEIEAAVCARLGADRLVATTEKGAVVPWSPALPDGCTVRVAAAPRLMLADAGGEDARAADAGGEGASSREGKPGDVELAPVANPLTSSRTPRRRRESVLKDVLTGTERLSRTASKSTPVRPGPGRGHAAVTTRIVRGHAAATSRIARGHAAATTHAAGTTRIARGHAVATRRGLSRPRRDQSVDFNTGREPPPSSPTSGRSWRGSGPRSRPRRRATRFRNSTGARR